jgi:pleckstrin homology domain-containing family A member 1/2
LTDRFPCIDESGYFSIQDTKPHRQIPLSQILDAMEYKSHHHHRETKHLGTGTGGTGGGAGVAAAVAAVAASTGNTSIATGGTLSNTHASTRPTSSSGLSGAEEEAGTLAGGKFTFKVITPKKTLLLCAPSEEEEVKWIGAIRVLIARRTSAEAGSGHVQGTSGSEVNKKKEGKEREGKEKESGMSGTRRRTVSGGGLTTAVLGGDKDE